SSHARDDGRIRAHGGGTRSGSDHRRGGRRGPFTWNVGGAYLAAGARCASPIACPPWNGFSSLHRPDAGGSPGRNSCYRHRRRHERRAFGDQHSGPERSQDPKKTRSISEAANRLGPDATRAMRRRYLPGATIGLMGSGQLGRMFSIAARRMGYRVHVFSPEKNTPAGQFADQELTAAYEDESAVRAFAKGLDLLTFEFENIPRQTIDWCAAECEVRPAAAVLHTAQNRLREKDFLSTAGIPVAAYRPVHSA